MPVAYISDHASTAKAPLLSVAQRISPDLYDINTIWRLMAIKQYEPLNSFTPVQPASLLSASRVV